MKPDEISWVMPNWIGRLGSWEDAHALFHSVLVKQENYDAERLVAAAIKFDLLPEDAVPEDTVIKRRFKDSYRAR